MPPSIVETIMDRPPRHNAQAERSILGSILINNQAFYRVIETVDVGDFFKDANKVIFAAMRSLAEASCEIDNLTLKAELAKRGQLEEVGGSAYIAALMDAVPDVANVERYARMVQEDSKLRQLLIGGNNVMRAANDVGADSAEVLALAERELLTIAERSIDRGFASLDRLTRQGMDAVDALARNRRMVTGVSTGYDRFDEFTSGFQPKELIILAARPSMGKTALMMNCAEAIAIPGRDGNPRPGLERLHNVAVFSLEMSREQLTLRILSSESGVPGHLMRSGMLSERNWRDLAEAAARMAKGQIYIDDEPGIDVMTLRAKARRLRGQVPLDLIMVDYLQLMSVMGKSESRQQEISQISRGLKGVAKDLSVPLVALSQLSRRPEQRTGDHRPQLADLRESGAIEQDADVVTFIYRDEVYNRDSEEKGIAEIIIAKQRNGPIGDFKLVFRNDLTKFYNYEPRPDYMPDHPIGGRTDAVYPLQRPF